MRNIKLLFFSIILFVVSSCQTNQYAVLSSKVADLEKDVDRLKQQYVVLEVHLSEQKARIHEFSQQQSSPTLIISDTIKRGNDDYVEKYNNNSSITTVKRKYSNPKKKVATGRCQAITKKGTRCKRNARPGSKFCWQHGG